MTYHIYYWLPGQSKLFSQPQHVCYHTDEQLVNTIHACNAEHYPIDHIDVEVDEEEPAWLERG